MRAWIGALALLGGCAMIDAFSTSSSSTSADAGTSADGGTTATVCTTPPCRELIVDVTTAPPSRDLDILFVVDNSESMKEEQDGLVRALPNFLGVLGAVAGGMPNLHVGVVSTDMGIGGWTNDQCFGAGDDGLLLTMPHVAQCQPPTYYYISDVDVDGVRKRNYTGAIGDTFACIAKLGITGCGVEQPLAAMKRALDGSHAENAGFLRSEAFLAIIILSDEDDCSAREPAVVFDPSPALDNLNSTLGPFASYRCTEFGVLCDGKTLPRAAASYTSCQSRGDSYLYHPSFYADFLKSLKPAALTVVAAISGPPTPFSVGLTERGTPKLSSACQTSNGIADPSVRLRDFVAAFPGQGSSLSICAQDLTPPMEEVGKQLSAIMSGSCLYGLLLDGSPMPGLQPDCRVYQHTGASGARTVLPSCQGTKPCYELTADATICPYSPAQLRLVVRRDDVPPAGTRYAVECFRP